MADTMNRFWREEGASRSMYYGGKLYFQNRHYKNAANDRNCLFPEAGCITLLHSCSYMDLYFCFFYIERGILICWWLTLRGREIYLLRSARDWNYPANAITWKNFSPVSRDPGTAIPGSRPTGLARLSYNREVEFCLINVPRSRQNDINPANRASSAHVIRPLACLTW